MDDRKAILTCVALSPRAAAVAAEGMRIARLLDARPAFVHVGPDTPATREALAKVLREAAVASGVAGHPAGDIAAEQLILREGKPYSVISRAAAEMKSEMIVLGALSRDPLLVGIWGSVARQVARKSACSVLMLSDPKPHRPSGDVIVASLQPNQSGGSDARSRGIVETVLEMARRGGVSSVHFVREFSTAEAPWAVGGTSRSPTTVEDYIGSRVAAEREALVDFLSDFDLSDLSDLNVRATALPGREGTEILTYAQSQRADLLVVPAPRRRMGFFGRFFRDPVELVMRRLSYALLLYRGRG